MRRKTIVYPISILTTMQKSQEILKARATTKQIFRFRIRSKSQKGKYHIVAWCGGDECECTCTAGQFHHPCRHVRIAKHHLKGLRAEKH
jgi:hypothetical protein